MTLTRRPADRTTMPLRTALERLMGDWPFVQVDGGLTDLAPPIDVRETDDSYVVEMDLPGVDPKELEILIEGRTLTIRGRTTEEREERQGTYLLRERRQGQFMRAVALPGMVEVDQISSHFENGQLLITLPKASQNRARRIEIPTNAGSSTNGRKDAPATRTDAAQAGQTKTSSSGQRGT